MVGFIWFDKLSPVYSWDVDDNHTIGIPSLTTPGVWPVEDDGNVL